MGMRIVIAAVLAFLATPAFAQSPPEHQPPATAQDCAVIAAVGENRLQWREHSPDTSMFAKSFAVDCNFKALGIKDFKIPPLPPGPYYTGVRFSFSKPVYAANGLAATVTFGLTGNAGPAENFISLSYCSAKKAGSQWLAECRAGPIT